MWQGFLRRHDRDDPRVFPGLIVCRGCCTQTARIGSIIGPIGIGPWKFDAELAMSVLPLAAHFRVSRADTAVDKSRPLYRKSFLRA